MQPNTRESRSKSDGSGTTHGIAAAELPGRSFGPPPLLGVVTMADRMCVGCPFRSPEQRAELLLYIAADPDEMWPCHESAEFNDLSPDDCQGRVIFGRRVAKLAAAEDRQ